MPEILQKIITLIVNPAIIFLFALAFVYFLWGGLTYIQNAADPEKRSEGAQGMLYGIIGLAVMMSSFGLVRYLMNIVNVPQDQRPTTSEFR